VSATVTDGTRKAYGSYWNRVVEQWGTRRLDEPTPSEIKQAGRWLAAALAAGRLGCDDGTDPAAAVSGAWLFLSDARASAAALARDLGCAQQQLAAVNGRPSARAGQEEGAF
jgi:hypothetical protein